MTRLLLILPLLCCPLSANNAAPGHAKPQIPQIAAEAGRRLLGVNIDYVQIAAQAETPFGRWELLYRAIIQVESKGDPNAVNRHGDGGLLQIRAKGKRGYLDEANRLSGREAYTDQDRFDPEKSREIWELIMAAHNPDSSIDKAIRLHNPGGGWAYAGKVKSEMEKIKNNND